MDKKLLTPGPLTTSLSTKEAMLHGYHVVLEKPLVPSRALLVRLYELAAKMHVCIYPFYNFRYSSDFMQIKKILKSSHLGRVRSISKKNKYVEKNWRGIGLRIEDDVLVTTKGCEVLSGKLPKEIKDIETRMSLN